MSSNRFEVLKSVSPQSEERECDNLDEEGMEVIEKGNEEVETEEMEARVITKRRLPEEPTQSEIDDHHLSGHTPFRQWCSACVMGSANSNPHHKHKDEDQSIPVVSMDYGYMESKNQEKGMPMLVMKDRKTKAIYANIVPEKGLNPYAVKRASKDLQLLGHDKIILKTDNEASIMALKRAIMTEKPVTIVPEEAPVRESQSNGEVENAVKQVQSKTRTLRLSIESRYEMDLNRDHPSIPWMLKHAADMLRRMSIGKDGRTAWERMKGKKFKAELA